MLRINWQICIVIILCNTSITVVPCFVKPLSEITVTEHTQTEFQCRLNKAHFEVEWFINGRPVHASDRYHVKHEGCSHKLVIPKTTKDDHGPVMAKAGDVKTKTNLQVNGEVLTKTMFQVGSCCW